MYKNGQLKEAKCFKYTSQERPTYVTSSQILHEKNKNKKWPARAIHCTPKLTVNSVKALIC